MTPEELMCGIGQGQFHQDDGLHCLALHHIDPAWEAKLGAEAFNLAQRNSPSDVNVATHGTNWTKPYGEALQYSLLNTTGRFDDFSTDHNNTPNGKSFHHGELYPATADLIAAFPQATNFRLNVMGPDSGLSPHEEDVVFKQGNEIVFKVRMHLPVFTSPDALMECDGKRYHFAPGVIHYFNNGCAHAALNRGDMRRLHFVWDQWLTEDVYKDWFVDAEMEVNGGFLPVAEDLGDVPPYEVQDAPEGWRVTYHQFRNRPHTFVEI